jgi:RNA polymerase-binding protein DksA
MTKSQQRTLRRQLEKVAARLRPDVRAITESTLNASGGQGITELSNAPMHLADTGTEEYMHELNATLLENEGFLLAEVQAAIARVDQGAFGRCESCGGDIAEERLEAIPYARLCIDCATASDNQPQANLNAGRPRSPADTLADEEEMEIPGRDEKSSLTDMVSSQDRQQPEIDVHAAGTPLGAVEDIRPAGAD